MIQKIIIFIEFYAPIKQVRLIKMCLYETYSTVHMRMVQ
jgi:hypothetical protein